MSCRPLMSDKPLPVYFRKSVNDLKELINHGDANRLTQAFIVDVHVQVVDGEPKAYLITELHGTLEMGNGS